MVDRDQDDFSESEEYISDSEKDNYAENTPKIGTLTKRKRLRRSTTAQMQKIQSYMQSHDDFSKGKTSESQELAWNNFTDELNSSGPPFHTGKEWRKVWSDWKGNQKRKRLVLENMTPPNPEVKQTNITQSEKFGMQSKAQTVTGEFIDQTLSANEESSQSNDFSEDENIHIQILKTLNVIVEQQKETNGEIKKLNNNFREFMYLFEPK